MEGVCSPWYGSQKESKRGWCSLKIPQKCVSQSTWRRPTSSHYLFLPHSIWDEVRIQSLLPGLLGVHCGEHSSLHSLKPRSKSVTVLRAFSPFFFRRRMGEYAVERDTVVPGFTKLILNAVSPVWPLTEYRNCWSAFLPHLWDSWPPTAEQQI